MVLNPLAFDNEEEFKKALKEEGLKRGWKPISQTFEETGKIGKQISEKILKRGRR